MQELQHLVNNGYVVNLVCILLSSLFTWFITKKNIRGWFKKQKFKIIFFFNPRQVVLVWCDELQCSKNIISGLAQTAGMYHYICLNKIMELLNYPLMPKYIHAVILIDTDVVKFGNSEKERNLIQQLLLKYLRNGGGVIGGHDILYKRVRNSVLIQEIGCQVTQFKRIQKPIVYKINETYQNSFFRDVPPVFELSDGEVCWGETTSDIKILASSAVNYNHGHPVPLIFSKRVGQGVFLWINSGDKDMTVCQSLKKADSNLIRIFKNFFDWYQNINLI